MSGVAAWEPIAWQLWRHRHMTWVQIRDHLALEGWYVHPLAIEAAVCERIGQRFERAANPPSGPGR